MPDELPESGDEAAEDSWLDADDEAFGDLAPAATAWSRPGSDPVHPLGADGLLLLVQATDALARFDARLGCASEAVADGLRARVALREAAGWLAHQGSWIHPTDLGLREAGLTGSYTAAAMAGRLRATLPATAEAGPAPDGVDDITVGQALRLGRLWRRLADLRSWAPLGDADTLRRTLAQIGEAAPAEAALDGWLARFGGRPGAEEKFPALIVAGQAAQAWTALGGAGEGRADRLSTAAAFLAACVWRQGTATSAVALPVWSATPQRLHRLVFRSGGEWLAGFLGVVADAAQRAGQELTRLQMAEARAAGLHRTARSKLPQAAEVALRLPVLTARTLADRLKISHPAALGLIGQLQHAGVLREATGRSAWRAFVVG